MRDGTFRIIPLRDKRTDTSRRLQSPRDVCFHVIEDELTRKKKNNKTRARGVRAHKVSKRSNRKIDLIDAADSKERRQERGGGGKGETQRYFGPKGNCRFKVARGCIISRVGRADEENSGESAQTYVHTYIRAYIRTYTTWWNMASR